MLRDNTGRPHSRIFIPYLDTCNGIRGGKECFHVSCQVFKTNDQEYCCVYLKKLSFFPCDGIN